MKVLNNGGKKNIFANIVVVKQACAMMAIPVAQLLGHQMIAKWCSMK